MRVETASWIATGVAGPIIAVWLGWTTLIVYYHRKKWRLLDPLLIIILCLSIVKQLGAVSLTTVELLRPADETWCSGLTWLLTATHTMEAGTITTLIFSKFLHLYLPRDKYRKTLSKSHLIYHLACLVLVSSCIGVAAVIGKADRCVYYSDKRYVSFWLTLHSILILVSFLVMLYSSCIRGNKLMSDQSVSNNYYQNQRRLLLNSSSDLSCALSDISMISSTKSRNSRGVNYSVSNCSSNNLSRRHCLVEELLRISSANNNNNQPVTFLNGSPEHCKFIYNTQLSNGSCHSPAESALNDKLSGSQQLLTGEELRLPEEVKLMEDSASCAAMHDCHLSTTTTSPSSTNSRAPVLASKHRKPEVEMQLITVVAIACLCFFSSHLPVMVVAFMDTILHQRLGPPWSSESFPIWTSLLEGCLLPIILLIFDDQFPARIAHIYKRRSAADVAGKPPQGLYGKFRAFNNSSIMESRRATMETVRFPITNGSLFTSLDGRIPIVHNYRRGKCIARSTSGILGNRCLNKCLSGMNDHGGSLLISNMVNVGSSGDSMDRKPSALLPAQLTAENNVHHNVDRERERERERERDRDREREREREREPKKPCTEHILRGQCFNQSITPTPPSSNITSSLPQTVKQLREKLFLDGSLASDDVSVVGTGAFNYDSSDEEPVYATLSSQSICSATTAANDDFEFFQHDSSAQQQQERKLFDNSGAPSESSTNYDNMTAEEVQPPSRGEEQQLQMPKDDCKLEMIKSRVNSGSVISSHNHRVKESVQSVNAAAAGAAASKQQHRSKVAPFKVEPRFRSQAGLRDSQRHRKNREAVSRRHPKKCRSPIVKRKAHWRPSSCNKMDHPGYNNQRGALQDPCRLKSSSLSQLSVLNEYDSRTCSSDDGPSHHPSHPSMQPLHHQSHHQRPLLTHTHGPHGGGGGGVGGYSHRYHPQSGRRMKMSRGGGGRPREFPPTPPTPRRLAPILSVDSLVTALNEAGVSYLDNGEVYMHPHQHQHPHHHLQHPNSAQSVPDLKKIFITDFL